MKVLSQFKHSVDFIVSLKRLNLHIIWKKLELQDNVRLEDVQIYDIS